MANPNRKKNLKKPWAKGESGNPKGRPPKVIKEIVGELKDSGFERITESQVRELYEYALTLNLNELKRIQSDEDTPLILRVVCKGLLSNKGYDVLESMLSRLNGRPRQTTMIGGADDNPIQIIVQNVKPERNPQNLEELAKKMR